MKYIYKHRHLYKRLILFSFVCFLSFAQAEAQKAYNKADSIFLKVFENKDFFGNFIDEYYANVYVRGSSNIKKKNFLYRYAPDFLYLDKDGKNSIVESLVKVHYKAPEFFSQQIVVINNSQANSNEIEERLKRFLQVNFYNPGAINDEIRLPRVEDAFRYYRFEYLSQKDTLGYIIHRIKVIPKVRSLQLVSGEYFIVDGTWIIFRIDLNGKTDFAKFRVSTEFGIEGKEFLLPLKTEVFFNTSLLGNKTENHYIASFDYTLVREFEPKSRPPAINYDLSEYFHETMDDLPYIADEKFWEEKRTIPLLPEEENLIKTNNDSTRTKVRKNRPENLIKGIFTPKRFNYNNSQMRYSGVLNPLKLAYSKWDGWVYWQQFRYSKKFENGRELQFSPNVGFLFQRKQAYFRTPIKWSFQPRRFGEFYFNFGNRNQTYNSSTVEMINETIERDSIRFEDLNLDYFHHLVMNLEAKYEVANGLIIRGGINYDWYIPIKKENTKNVTLRSSTDEDFNDLINDKYKIFTPMIGLIWTPHQYYRINGKRKEYVRSDFPTFSIEYVWGVNGFLESNSNYTKVEADIQQKIKTGLMSSFQYYIGAGKFVNTRSLYFANFNYFQKRNFPQAWDDPIGGVFHLLSNQWYDASNKYLQAHIMYEFSCTLLRPFRGITKDILKERLYASQLYTPSRTFYSEIGYGIGNFIGNAGIFVSFSHLKYEAVGVKFAFELGK